MKPYHEFLLIVSTHQPCTRSHLELLARGKFRKDVEECIRLGHIVPSGKNEHGDVLYSISATGWTIID